MAYKALYRKYRPETFDTMVGQKHIVTTLKNAIANDKIAHAYIFSGPRGTGKTTTAKILAKALNCTSDHKPCNDCDNCRAINEGTHPDIIEIDAASNNGVDEVRELIDKVKYAPIQGKYKVYIIDEVHMMTSGAFNALLKTLEEPPAHVVFILATTDVHKVLPTILSRCQRFDFNKIGYIDIQNRVEEILNLEQVTFDDKVSNLIAELADGGMRDALSILDQVVSYAGNHITLQHVYDVYGIMSSNDMVDYLTMMADSKTKDVLEMIENFISKGIDVKRLTYDLMVCLKDAVIYKSTKDATILERLNEENCIKVLKSYSIDTALKTVEILNEALNNFRQSSNYRLFFELASLKIIETIAENKDVFKEEPVIERKEVIVEKKEEPVVVEAPKEEKVITPIPEVRVPQRPVEEKVEDITPIIKKSYNVPEDSEIISYSMEEYVNILCQGDKKVKTDLLAKWTDIKKYINKPETRYIAQLLADSTVGVANKEFILIVYDFKLLVNRAKQKNNIILIRKFINDIFGIDVEIFVVERATFIDITNKFFELRQANKLPPRTPIPHVKVDIEEQKKLIKEEKEEEDATVTIGKNLFGDALKIE